MTPNNPKSFFSGKSSTWGKGLREGGVVTYQGPDILKVHSLKDPWPPLDLPLIAFLPI